MRGRFSILLALGSFLGLLLSLLAICCKAHAQEPHQPPRAASPNEICRAVVTRQLELDEHDRPYMIWLPLTMRDQEMARKYHSQWYWWVHQLSLERIPVYPKVVTLAGFSALEIDRRNYRWIDEAWAAVAREHPYYTAASVDAQTIKIGNQLAGYPGEHKVFLAAVRADWLYDQTMDESRSKAYWRLLCGEQRFKGSSTQKTADVYEMRPKYEIRTERFWHPGGPLRFAGGRSYSNAGAGYWSGPRKVKIGEERVLVQKGTTTTTPGQEIDFPETIEDLEKLMGMKTVREYSKDFHFDLIGGTIAAGSTSDHSGSFVARNDRFFETVRTPAGWGARTYDAISTTGDTDYLEQSDRIVAGKIAFQGGEAFFMLPNGGLVGMLFDRQGRRIALATGDLVTNREELKYSRHAFTVVGNARSCIACHMPDDGYIEPRNEIVEALKDGVEPEIFKDPALKREYLAFYRAQSREIQRYRMPYRSLIEEATKEAGKELTSLEMTKQTFECADSYDDPVSPAQQAWELGLDLRTYQRLAADSEDIRIGRAALGRSMPRNTWETKFSLAASLAYRSH